MIFKSKKFLLIIIFITSLNLSADETYIVKSSETLSDILYAQNIKPIYGKHGALKIALKMNPFLKFKGDVIYAGQEMKLPMYMRENVVNANEVKIEEVKVAEVKIEEAKVEKVKVIEAVDNLVEIKNVAQSPSAARSISELDTEQYIFFRLMPQVSWMKVSSESSTANINSHIEALSKANPGLVGALGINVSENLNVQVFGDFSQVNFYSNPKQTLSKYSFSRQSFGVGGEYLLDPSSKLKFNCGFYDEFFLTMKSLNKIEIEKAQIPEFHWEYHKVLKQYKNVTFDMGLFGKIILPYSASTIEGKLGYGLGGDANLKFKNKGIRFFYNYSDAKAKNKTTQTHELGWNIIFESKIFE